MIDLLRIIVDAGATPASAARAAVILADGGSVADAERAIVLADDPATFDSTVLLDEISKVASRTASERANPDSASLPTMPGREIPARSSR